MIAAMLAPGAPQWLEVIFSAVTYALAIGYICFAVGSYIDQELTVWRASRR